MENLLEIDLNEVATKQIAQKIGHLEGDLKTAQGKISEQNRELQTLKKQVEKSETALGLLEYLRSEFAKIKSSKADDNGYYESKQKNQFLYIERVLLNIFNIEKEANGWYCSRSDGGLAPHLAVNFYSNKDVVIDLLKMIMADPSKEVTFIKSFRMPFDYAKEDVVEYVKNPQYNTNGCIFGISQYWIENGAGKKNMPHDLIMKSPFILENDVFEMVLNTINKKASNFYYLFALPKHNKNISDDQIRAMGEFLIGLKDLNYSEVISFISDNLKKFNDTTLKFLYTKIRSDNQFNTLHWEKFPNQYQMKFLMEKPLDEVLKIITNYSCTWTSDQKRTFLKDFVKI